MANPYFQFKQFTVWHDRCAMKVGTDAVLLGSWMQVADARRLLDIGTGCGLIALMAAQRCPKGQVSAVELDPDAALQAQENISRSPWSNRIDVVCTDIRTFHADEPYDVIFSNPPYFVSSLKCPDSKRTTARHTDTLDFDTLMSKAASLLSPCGEFSLVVPTEAVPSLMASAVSHLLHLSRHTLVCTKPGAKAKRTLLAFRKEMPAESIIPETLLIEQSTGRYSDEFQRMVRDFYLDK